MFYLFWLIQDVCAGVPDHATLEISKGFSFYLWQIMALVWLQGYFLTGQSKVHIMPHVENISRKIKY